MPELPDVENFKRYFKKTSLNKRIVEITCSSKDLIKNTTLQHLAQRLISKSFKGASRRGKFLIIDIEGIREKLVIHFGMTGNFLYLKPGAKDRQTRFSRLKFRFQDGSELHWLNIRKLGKIYLVKDLNQVGLIKEMGPEPLSLSKVEFLRLLERYREKNIKAFLLDQRDIAGIGNIYSDEILFQAKISPQRKIKTLNLDERDKLYQVMKRVLKEAIKVRPPSGRFESSWLLNYREKGARCPRNKNHSLRRELIATRPAYFCPICQK
jgi:formamidopyrimidine-DNA glycosylase